MRPIRELIEAEAQRAEADLASFRSRSVAVVTTSSGIVTLLTGVFTFAASKTEDEAGLPDSAIVLLALSSACLVGAAVLALVANRSGDIDRPSGSGLERYVGAEKWAQGAADPDAEERDVARVLVDYVTSIRTLSDSTAQMLNRAIGLQILGVLLVAVGGVVAMSSFG